MTESKLAAVLDHLRRMVNPLRVTESDHCLLAQFLASRDEAAFAALLGCPIGTVQSRLARGRKLLQKRLADRGLALSTGGLAIYLTGQTAMAALPAKLFGSTLSAAAQYASGKALSAVVPTSIVMLVNFGLKATALTKLLWISASILGLGLLAGGVGLAARNLEIGISGPPVANQRPRAESTELAAQKPSQDSLGDPLPPGAVARLGTVRFNHGDGLSSLHYSSDGKTLLSLQQSGKTTLHFYDLNEGKEVRVIDLDPRYSLIRRAALSPDGQYAALPLHDAVHVFETATGGKRFHTNNQGGDVQFVTFSGDSKTLIQSGKGGVLEVWDAANGKPLKSFTQSPVAQVLATSPNGRWLATLEHHTYAIDKLLDKDAIHLWDLQKGKEARVFTKRGWFMRIFFTPDSKRLLASNCIMGEGYTSLGWDLSSGQEIHNPVPDLLFARAFIRMDWPKTP
jgi:hypothetical protein